MAGHSKFANIMHRKGGQDKKRAAQFTKLAREMQAAVKLGGSDPASNPRLFRAIATARGMNMPKDNIQRAIDRGAGANAEALEEVRYEGFGPGGIGVIVESLTDNRNRRNQLRLVPVGPDRRDPLPARRRRRGRDAGSRHRGGR
ncbi:MAG: hypothetical protein FD124_2231 [Alphaproteobacteria bacterium]|nr:MAG: hypothetical protein FD124_2231 [Alphaproteobacteria bacterium]